MNPSRMMLCRMLEGKCCAVVDGSDCSEKVNRALNSQGDVIGFHAVLSPYDSVTDSFGTVGQIVKASDVNFIRLIELLQEVQAVIDSAFLKTSC